MINVALFSTSGLISRQGISTVLYDYFSRIDKREYKITYLVDGNYSQELVDQYLDGGIGIRFLPSRKKETLSFYRELHRMLSAEQFDVFYINGSSAIMGLDLIVAKLSGCRVRIAHSHNTKCDHNLIDRFLRPLFYHSYTHAFACGKDAGEWLFHGRDFEILYNGRCIKDYQFNKLIRENMREKYNIGKDTIVIGHVGSFCEQKNQKFLIDILTKFGDADVKLFLIGDGDKFVDVCEYAETRGVITKVNFIGAVSNVPEYLQMMDVMVLPSLFEGLPLVVIEWQIAGLPCLISDCISSECACTNLVEFENLNTSPRVWADRILKIANSHRILREKENDCLCTIMKEKGFDIDENVKRMELLLKQYVNI